MHYRHIKLTWLEKIIFWTSFILTTAEIVHRVKTLLFYLRAWVLFHPIFKTRLTFNISKYVSFSQHHTRSGSFRKLVQPLIKHNRDKQFYFNRLPHLWMKLSSTNWSESLLRNHQIQIEGYLLERVHGKFRPWKQLHLLLLLPVSILLLPAKISIYLVVLVLWTATL